MLSSSLLPVLALLSTTASAQWTLADDYFSGNFFDHFSFFTGSDPTHGNVAYQSEAAAASAGLISSSASNARMSVDSSNAAPNGRASVRISSNKSYNSGTLVILDLEHMPTGCGTWPAFWMLGPNWPNSGEIDIIEGVHEQTSNDMTLHTGPGCTISDNGLFSGAMTTTTCESSGSNNNGCQIATSDTRTYGKGFNDDRGGVYATQFTDSAISVFFFPRNSVPDDISHGWPQPSNWGKPLAMFQGACDIPSHFKDMQLVFDITFCGDWAGNTWSSSTCASKADTCSNFVANNPSAFNEAYWSINSLKVYTAGSGAPASVIVTGDGSSVGVTEPPVAQAISKGTTLAVSIIDPTTTSNVASSTAPAIDPAKTHHPFTPHWSGSGTVSESEMTAREVDALDGADGGPILSESFAAYHGGPKKYGSVMTRERYARHLRQHKRHGAGKF